MSRYESTVEAQIEAESSESKKCALRMKLAAYRSRRGDFDRAKSDIAEARARFGGGASALLTAYINFAEGVFDYFAKGAASSLPKLQRARALSQGSFPVDDLQSLSAAWLATTYRVLGDWQKMTEQLVDVFPVDQNISSETKARASIVLADSWQEVCNYQRAEAWYRAARKHSIDCGDDMSIGAMLYNRAAIRIFNIRLQEIDRQAFDIESCRIALEAASAENYSLYSEDRSMRWVFDLLKSQIAMLGGDCESTLRLQGSVDESHLAKDWPAVELLRRADFLRCSSVLGLIGAAEVKPAAEQLVAHFENRVGRGDLGAACWSISLALVNTDSQAAELYANKARAVVKEFLIRRKEQESALDVFERSVSSRASLKATLQ